MNFIAPVIYDANGRALPLLIEHGPQARRVAGLSLIEADLRRCHRGFSHLAVNYDAIATRSGGARFFVESDPQQFAEWCMWAASVVGYGKCFAAADGRGAKLERQHVEALGERFVSCHDELIEDRNNYIAHGGTSLNEGSRLMLVVDSYEPLRLHQVTFTLQASLPSKEHCITAAELCVALADDVDRRAKEACERLEADLRKLPAEELRQRSVQPPPKPQSVPLSALLKL